MQIPGPVGFALHGGSPCDRSVNAVMSFRVADLEAAIVELTARGHELTRDITDTGQARFAEYADPDGNLIHILERVTPGVGAPRPKSPLESEGATGSLAERDSQIFVLDK